MATGTQKLRPQAKMTQISTARVSNTRQKASQSQELGMRDSAWNQNESCPSSPFQRAFFVQPYVSDQQNPEEHEHRNQRKQSHVCYHPAAVQNRPRNQEHCLHVEHDEQHGNDVKPYGIASAGMALRSNPALVRFQLRARRSGRRPDQLRKNERHRGKRHNERRINQDGEIGTGHTNLTHSILSFFSILVSCLLLEEQFASAARRFYHRFD